MRIAIDASSLAVSHKTGVAKYVLRLIESLEKIDDENDYSVCYRLSRWKKREHFYRPEREGGRLKLFQEPFFSGRGIDVFHGPDARLPGLLGPKGGRPRLVATLHDVFSLVSEEFSNEKFRHKLSARYADIAERADIVICDSKSTRNDFLRFFPEAEPRTRVIYLGVDDAFTPQPADEIDRVRKKYGIESDYVFYVGALSVRKNALRMFEAFRRARERTDSNLQFVAAGRLTYGRDRILEYMKNNRCGDEILLPGYVPDEDLPALYSGARLFLFATLYEGFGLPVLEAAACGVPVITSNIGSTAEIADGIARLVDPLSVEDISEALLHVMDAGCSAGDGPASDLPKRKWTDMARDVLSIYEELMRNR